MSFSLSLDSEGQYGAFQSCAPLQIWYYFLIINHHIKWLGYHLLHWGVSPPHQIYLTGKLPRPEILRNSWKNYPDVSEFYQKCVMAFPGFVISPIWHFLILLPTITLMLRTGGRGKYANTHPVNPHRTCFPHVQSEILRVFQLRTRKFY